MISPLDVNLVQTWRDNGISLRTVCRAIARGVEKFRGANPGRGAPRSLSYFEKQVMAEARAVRAAREGAHAHSVAGESPEARRAADLRALRAIASELALLRDAGENPAFSPAYDRARTSLLALGARLEEGEEADLPAEVSAVDAAMVVSARDALGEADAAAVGDEVEAQLAPQRGRLGVLALADIRRRLTGEVMSKRHGLARIQW